MPKVTAPTVAERVFLENYLKHHNGTEAALVAYNIQGKNKRKIASTMASQILRRPHIREYLEGKIPDNDLVEQLKACLQATRSVGDVEIPLWSTRLRTLELIFKVKGYLDPQSSIVSKSHGKLTVHFNQVRSK